MLFLFVGGGSGVGKSQIIEYLIETLNEKNLSAVTIAIDNYYKDRP